MKRKDIEKIVYDYWNEPRKGTPEQCIDDLLALMEPSEMKIVPSPKIDYCVACDAEHGHDCPKGKSNVCGRSAAGPVPLLFRMLAHF